MTTAVATRTDTLRQIEQIWDVNLCACKRVPVEIKNCGRKDLAQVFAELGFREGVEVGTEEGRYAEVLCKANPALHLTCVDPWLTSPDYRAHVTQYVMEALCELAVERLAPYNVTLHRETSVEAVRRFPDGALDFVYIDGRHEQAFVAEDIATWSPKVRSGGIVSGHDYVRRTGVIDAVQAYTTTHRIKPWAVLTGDRSPSWLWVKP